LFGLPGHRDWAGLSHSIIVSLKIVVMKKNMGSADRIIRVIAAIVFAVLYFTGTVTGTLGIVLLVLGAVFVLTSVVSFCPLYLPFGLSTCSAKGQKAA
jgi:hypothetical protein